MKHEERGIPLKKKKKRNSWWVLYSTDLGFGKLGVRNLGRKRVNSKKKEYGQLTEIRGYSEDTFAEQVASEGYIGSILHFAN